MSQRPVWLALLFATSASAAIAQTATPPAPQPDTAVVGEIIVTGTRIRGVEAVGSKPVVLDRETLEATGFNNPVQVLRNVPQVQGLGFDEVPHVAQNGQSNVQRGTTISLRGLSANATLLLIDGRRVAPTGNVSTFTEANQLPVSFIERIDVVADGASAIYGSDAVAGVVNYITRKNFNGLEATARYTTALGWHQEGGSVLAGKTWSQLGPFEDARLIVAADYDQRSAMLQGKLPFLRQDLRRYGGSDNRVRTNLATSGAPGNIIVSGTSANTTLPSAGNFIYYGVPAGYSGTGLTGAQLLVNQPNLLDSADFQDYLPKTVRQQVSLNFDANLTDDISVYYHGYGSRRSSDIRTLVQSPSVTVPASAPYYIPGVPGLAPGAAESVSFSFLKDIGRGIQGLAGHVVSTSYGQTAGAEWKLPKEWRTEFAFTSSMTRTCAQCLPAFSGNILNSALQAAINDGSYNPFSSAPASQAVLARFMIAGKDYNRTVLNQTSLRFDGPLFELPAGAVRTAFGFEHMYLGQGRYAQDVQNEPNARATSRRKINSIYGELFIPLLAEGVVPFVRRLDLDLAGRVEDYSDFGRTSNPKVGLVWDVVKGLTVRGSWGTSFRAPNFAELSKEVFYNVQVQNVANNAGDPALPLTNAATRQSTVVRVNGGNPDLVPETAKNLTLGVDVRPQALPGFRLSLTYYKITYDDQIIGLTTTAAQFIASAANRAQYAPYITPAAQPATCVPGNRSTYNPVYQKAFNDPALTGFPDETNACRAVALFDARYFNASSTVQDGVDLQTGYDVTTDYGRFNVDLNGTYILGNKIQAVPNAAAIEGLDRINNPVSKRGRASLGWSNNGLSANLAYNYIGSYTNDLPITVAGVTKPISKVKAWGAVDLNLAYRAKRGDGVFAGTRVSLNIQNLLDREPPVVLSTNGNAADVQTHSVFGRIIAVQLSKSF